MPHCYTFVDLVLTGVIASFTTQVIPLIFRSRR